jgi:type III pantothenate kinase
MNMILDLDIGNTRCKWRLSELSSGSTAVGAGPDVERVFSEIIDNKQKVTRVRVANVAGPAVADAVAHRARAQWGVTPEFARTERTWGQVRNAYEDVSRLGVDRWLAVCAAWHRIGGSCLVIDAGSAITVDYLADSGQHQGGYIVPGLRLLQQSLLKDTADVRFAEDRQDVSVEPGRNTEQAVKHGTLKMAASFVQAICHEAGQRPGGEAPVLLTGGDAELVQAVVGRGATLVPGLVLEGLALVLP